MAYIVLYEPFIFVRDVPSAVRILIEFSFLFILLLLWLSKAKPRFIPYSFLIIPLLLLWLFLADETRSVNGPGGGWFPGFITKIIFLIFGVIALKPYPTLVKALARVWAFVWVFIGVQVTLAAIGYALGIIHFTLEGDWKLGIMEYYYNPIFGQLDSRGFKGATLPQFSGFLMEPLFLGLFAGLNVLTASILVSKKYQKLFRILSYVTGLLSGSVSFLLFFCSFAAYKFVGKYSSRGKLISFFVLAVVGLAVSWFMLVDLGIGEASSFGVRAVRISIALNALMHSSLHGLLFGTYNYSQLVGEQMSASCGILSFLLQRGVILFIPVMYLLFKYAKKDHYVLAYLFYYALLLEYFWWPAFVVYLVVFYCLSSQAEGVVADQETSPAGSLVEKCAGSAA